MVLRIWDRIDRIIDFAGLKDVPTYQVLDCCHAVHHVSMALASLGLTASNAIRCIGNFAASFVTVSGNRSLMT